MYYLIDDNGKMSLFSINTFPIIHCADINRYEIRPVCGKKLPPWRCLSRQDFKDFPSDKKCKACANTKYARFI